ncbi:MAG: hypothetical protein DRJ49_02200 [Thermoprotei archaeon]|nr:MAG: hypothetical protein DRN53_02820 [Thermoprotei archaeon]RLE89704.1 MAG: hypothetical protein DRJ49_02200 [Thermoprotei archaeon]
MILGVLKKLLRIRKRNSVNTKVSELRNSFIQTIGVKENLKSIDVKREGESLKAVIEELRRREDYLELEL